MAKATEVFEKVTAAIINSIETAPSPEDWVRPWNSLSSIPHNPTTGKAYRGGNVIALWFAQADAGYPTSQWATYKQIAAAGGQVRKGERGTTLVKWNPIRCKDHGPEERCSNCGRLVPNSFTVFNIAQQDGYAPVDERDALSDAERIEAAERFFEAVGAEIKHGGDRAFYRQVGDFIQLPDFADFRDAESYYATLAHESVHWTGHKDRLDRTFGKRFGDDHYAAEELVAELGSAFLCAYLGISPEPRADHAQYLASWLKVLRSEPQALFDAAGKAQKALDLLVELADRELVAA